MKKSLIPVAMLLTGCSTVQQLASGDTDLIQLDEGKVAKAGIACQAAVSFGKVFDLNLAVELCDLTKRLGEN